MIIAFVFEIVPMEVTALGTLGLFLVFSIISVEEAIAGFSNKADAEGPTAGFDPVIGKVMKRKKYIKLPPGSRKRWMKKDESK